MISKRKLHKQNRRQAKKAGKQGGLLVKARRRRVRSWLADVDDMFKQSLTCAPKNRSVIDFDSSSGALTISADLIGNMTFAHIKELLDTKLQALGVPHRLLVSGATGLGHHDQDYYERNIQPFLTIPDLQ